MPQSNQDAGGAAARETQAATRSNGEQSSSQEQGAGAEQAGTEVSPVSKVSPGLMAHLGLPEDVVRQITGNEAGEQTQEPEPEQEQTPAAEGEHRESEQPDGEQPEGEQPEGEQPEPEPEPEGEEPEAEHDVKSIKDLPDHVAQKVQKRIDKLVYRKQKAESRAEELEIENGKLKEQLEGAEPVTVAPTANDPLAHVRDQKSLQNVVTEARALRDWCRKNRNGCTVDEGTEKERTITAEQVQSWLDSAEDTITEYAPTKAAELQAREQYNAVAKETYPELFDRASPLYQQAQAVMKNITGFATHPAGTLGAGDLLLGLAVRNSGKVSEVLKLINAAAATAERSNGNGSAAAKPPLQVRKQPPLTNETVKPPSGLPSPRANTKRVEDAMDHVVQDGGSVESLAAALRAKREASGADRSGKRPALV